MIMIMIIIIIIINNIVILWSRLKRFTLPGKLPLGASNNKFLKVPKESLILSP